MDKLFPECYFDDVDDEEDTFLDASTHSTLIIINLLYRVYS